MSIIFCVPLQNSAQVIHMIVHFSYKPNPDEHPHLLQQWQKHPYRSSPAQRIAARGSSRFTGHTWQRTMQRLYLALRLRSARVSASTRAYFVCVCVCPCFTRVAIIHLCLAPVRSDAEGELSLCAGDYILVWGSGDAQGGYFDAELLDGRRGLVPANFITRLIGA